MRSKRLAVQVRVRSKPCALARFPGGSYSGTPEAVSRIQHAPEEAGEASSPGNPLSRPAKLDPVRFPRAGSFDSSASEIFPAVGLGAPGRQFASGAASAPCITQGGQQP